MLFFSKNYIVFTGVVLYYIVSNYLFYPLS
ncbi:hypothetical protein EXIGUO9Y_270048 [Exiguobacterium oxidotolerans]|uniref:Uncharacterized protein n=1 Tax=Exiguobacterium oxidotolerans TaxID=223958 RepID=A0A653I9W9_9BACL|nr:hypothetical protein EXIGUO9Y_270048 [Exiguobacterium oxidotolerans]